MPPYLSLSKPGRGTEFILNSSVWDQGLVKKNTHFRVKQSHTHNTLKKWRSFWQWGWGGFVWFGPLPLSDEWSHFFLCFMKDEGRGRVIGASMQGNVRMPSQMSAHTFPPFFFILCAFFIFHLSLHLSTKLLRSYHLSLSHLDVEASQVTHSKNQVWKYTWIFQLLINLLSDFQIPHHSCAHVRTHTNKHA